METPELYCAAKRTDAINPAADIHSAAGIGSAAGAYPAADAYFAPDAYSDADAAPSTAAYSEAKELAESYADLLKQKEAYRSRMGTFPHYTLDDAYYLLTQGAHAQSERVQTSTISNPTAKAVEAAEQLMNRLNREMDEEYQAEVVDPYLDICEKLTLFDLCMTLLNREQQHIADQLYVQRKSKKYVTDEDGKRIPRKRMDKEVHTILTRFSEVLQDVERARCKTHTT